MEESVEGSVERETASLLEGVLDLVDAGDLIVDGPAGRALVQRLEGALLALRLLKEQKSIQGS